MKTKYDNMSASQLGELTRERGLEKPQVLTLKEWAEWLAAQDETEATTEKPVKAEKKTANDNPQRRPN